MADAHAAVRWGILTGDISALLGDSIDPGQVPDQLPLEGTIHATPIGTDESGNIVPIRELRFPEHRRLHWVEDVEIPVVEGIICPVGTIGRPTQTGIGMVASVQPEARPGNLSWLLRFRIPGAEFEDRVIDIAPDVQTDIASAVPATPAPGVVVVVSEETRIAAEAAAQRAEDAAASAEETVGQAADDAAAAVAQLVAADRVAAEQAAQDAAASAAAAAAPTEAQMLSAISDDGPVRTKLIDEIEGQIQVTPPASHTHPLAQVEGLPGELAEKAADSAVVHLTGDETIAGVKTFDVAPVVPDGAFAVEKINGLTAAVEALGDGRWARKDSVSVSVRQFGAVGDGVTDDLPAFQATYQYVRDSGGGTILIPKGRYLLSDEWDIFRPASPRVDIVIRGESQWSSIIVAGFYGAGKAVIKCYDPNSAVRASPTSVYNLQITSKDRNGASPTFIDVRGMGESRIESVRFGPCDGTPMRLSSLQNVRMRDIVSFYGGHHFAYKNTTGITFSSTAGTNVITASAAIFTGNDVGRVISLYGPTNRSMHRITAFTSSTQVSVSGETPAITHSNVPGYFESARISTTAGSTQVSANAQCFTANDVGRVIYIKDGREGPWGPTLHRATITGLVSAATVTVDVAPTRSVTRTEFAVPVIDLWSGSDSSTGVLNADSNDVKLELMHVENFSGVGLVVQRSIFMHLNDFKVHGEVTPTSTQSTVAHMWLDDYGGILSGELDGMAMGTGRIHLSGFNDLTTFDWLASRMNINEKLFTVSQMSDPGGICEVRTVNTYRASANADPWQFVDDPNTPSRVWFAGMTNMLGDTQAPRFYLGRNSYVTQDGSVVLRSPNGTGYRLAVSDAGQLSTTPA